MKNFFILCLLLLSSTFLNAQSGVLDASFGTGGTVLGTFSSLSTHFHDVVRQSDGKYIVVGGETTPTLTYNLITMRFNANGSIDNTYGISGKTEYPFALPLFNYSYAIALQSTGNIIVAANSEGAQSGALVLRYLPNGTLDPLFATGGVFFQAEVIPRQLAIQTDDRILIVGNYYDGSGYESNLTRLTLNGQLDNTFGSSGVARYSQGGIKDAATNSLVIQPNGSIIVAGTIGDDFNYDTRDYLVMRYTASGVLDNTFNGTGVFTLSIKDRDIAISTTLQSDGKILVVGQVDTNSLADIGLIRLTSSGALDITFNGSGKKIIANEIGAIGTYARSVFFQNDGGILVVAYASAGLDETFIYKLVQNGASDNSFGTSGKARLNGTRDYTARNAILQPDNKIMIVGESFNYITYDFAYFMARFGNGATPNIIKEIANENLVMVYPNPASKFILIENNYANEVGEYQLVSLTGQVLLKGIINKQTTLVDVNELTEGLYLVKIQLGQSTKTELLSILK